MCIRDSTYGVAAAGFIGSEAPYTNYLPQFWQNAYPNFTYDENGVWYDGFNTQETKDALLRLQQAYADGVIDPESLTCLLYTSVRGRTGRCRQCVCQR